MKTRFVWILVLIFVLGALYLGREHFGAELPITSTCRPKCQANEICKIIDGSSNPVKSACV